MRPVLVDVARVDDKEISVFLKAVEVRIVDGAAVLVRDDAVLRLIEIEREHVAGQDILQKCGHVWPLDVDTAHVGDVEDAAVPAAEEMLRDDAIRVLDGHIPAAEVNHRRAGVKVRLIEYGSFQFAHVLPPFSYRRVPQTV